jgi:hypothetical protein
VEDVSYPKLAVVEGTHEHGPQYQPASFIFTTNLNSTNNITIERQLYDLFNRYVAKYLGIGDTVSLIHEVYSTKAVQTIASDSTAYPHRAVNHLLYVNILSRGDIDSVHGRWS